MSVEFPVHLNLRRKGAPQYERVGIVDLGHGPHDRGELRINLPEGREVRVRIDENHLIPVHDRSLDAVPVIYASEV